MTYSKSRMAAQESPKTVDKIIVLPASVVGSVELSSVEVISEVVEGSKVVVGIESLLNQA